MIRPTLPSEALQEFKHTAFQESITKQFYNYIWPHYKWCNGILKLGVMQDELLFLSYYFQDALILGFDSDCHNLVTNEKIKSYPIKKATSDINLLGADFDGEFSVAITNYTELNLQLSFINAMKKYLKKGGLLVVEQVTDPATMLTNSLRLDYINTSHILAYWLKA